MRARLHTQKQTADHAPLEKSPPLDPTISISNLSLLELVTAISNVSPITGTNKATPCSSRCVEELAEDPGSRPDVEIFWELWGVMSADLRN